MKNNTSTKKIEEAFRQISLPSIAKERYHQGSVNKSFLKQQNHSINKNSTQKVVYSSSNGSKINYLKQQIQGIDNASHQNINGNLKYNSNNELPYKIEDENSKINENQINSKFNFNKLNKINDQIDKFKQFQQPFVQYKYRTSVNSCDESQNINNTVDFNNFDISQNGGMEYETIKEEFRDPILNIQKHKKEYGTNIAKKMNRFYNIKALNNKSQLLKVAFDNSNNLFIVDQRDYNYIPNSVMNQNLELSRRKQNSINVLQKIIQNNQNQINQSEGLSTSIITNGKESQLSSIGKKSPYKKNINSSCSSQMITKQSYYTPQSILNSFNQPKKSNLTNNSISQETNYFLNHRSSVQQMESIHDYDLKQPQRNRCATQTNSLEYFNQSQFDKYQNKKSTIPLVDTRKALIKNYQRKNRMIHNEGQQANSFNKKMNDIQQKDSLATQTIVSRQNSVDTTTQQTEKDKIMKTILKSPDNFSTQNNSTLNTKQNFFYTTQPQNFTDQNNLLESLKTWKVNQINDDFNRISKDHKKYYYRSQFNNQNEQSVQIAYLTSNGKYGFFTNKTDESIINNQQKDQSIYINDKMQEFIKQESNNNTQNETITLNQQVSSEAKDNNQQLIKNIQDMQNSNKIDQISQDKNKETQLQQPQIQIINPINIDENDKQANKKTEKLDNISINKQEAIQSFQLKNSLAIKKNSIKGEDVETQQINSNQLYKIPFKTVRDISYGRKSLEIEDTPIHKNVQSRKKSKTQHVQNTGQKVIFDNKVDFTQDLNFLSINQLIINNKKIKDEKKAQTKIQNVQNNQISLADNLQNIEVTQISGNNMNKELIQQNELSTQHIQQTETEQINQKQQNKYCQTIDTYQSQENSLENSHIAQSNQVSGFHFKDKNDDDEDLQDYLQIQNIIPL